MTFDDVIEQWKQDALIDNSDLDTELLRIPQLHAKYLNMLNAARRKNRVVKEKQKALLTDLTDYYKGDLNNPDDLARIKRKPYERVHLKNEAAKYAESDKEYIEATLKVGHYQDLVSAIEEIMKNINTRGFNIKSAIEWRKLTQFGQC